MQTFVHSPDVHTIVKQLDKKRLFKQTVETFQLMKAIAGLYAKRDDAGTVIKDGWSSHPAANMWRGHTYALLCYQELCVNECIARGINYSSPNVYEKTKAVYDEYLTGGDLNPPAWWGDERVHGTHRANLLRKDLEDREKQLAKGKDHVLQYHSFGWSEKPYNIDGTQTEYIWPVDKTGQMSFYSVERKK